LVIAARDFVAELLSQRRVVVGIFEVVGYSDGDVDVSIYSENAWRWHVEEIFSHVVRLILVSLSVS
jgi:hypothetical protein